MLSSGLRAAARNTRATCFRQRQQSQHSSRLQCQEEWQAARLVSTSGRGTAVLSIYVNRLSVTSTFRIRAKYAILHSICVCIAGERNVSNCGCGLKGRGSHKYSTPFASAGLSHQSACLSIQGWASLPLGWLLSYTMQQGENEVVAGFMRVVAVMNWQCCFVGSSRFNSTWTAADSRPPKHAGLFRQGLDSRGKKGPQNVWGLRALS